MADMAQRFGMALEALFAGRHRAKRVARALDCSPRQAEYLLSGQRWTVKWLQRASDALGDAWDAALARPVPEHIHDIEMQDIRRRLARLEEAHFAMARRQAQGMAPDESGAGGAAERAFPAPVAGAPADGRTDDGMGEGKR